MQQPLQDWKIGDPLAASHLQEVVNFAKRTGDIQGGPGVQVSTNTNGTIINLSQGKIFATCLPCKIVAAPSAGLEHTDERYYVQQEVNAPDAGNTETTALNLISVALTAPTSDDIQDYTATPFIASNLSEYRDHTHNLGVNQRVLVWRIHTLLTDDTSSDLYYYYVFECADVGCGQYKGMVLQTVSQNARGWALLRSTPLLPT